MEKSKTAHLVSNNVKFLSAFFFSLSCCLFRDVDSRRGRTSCSSSNTWNLKSRERRQYRATKHSGSPWKNHRFYVAEEKNYYLKVFSRFPVKLKRRCMSIWLTLPVYVKFSHLWAHIARNKEDSRSTFAQNRIFSCSSMNHSLSLPCVGERTWGEERGLGVA